MHKARAMLDALMGPGRDKLDKDKNAITEKLKDPSVCKCFLIGICPFNANLLGGKRNFAVCDKIHSEVMRDQLKSHEDSETMTRDYEVLCMRDLEYAIRECEGHIAQERQRIRTDVRRKKPPLPPAVNDKLSGMRRESSNMIQQAEKMDDDQIREKEALITKANELLKEREEMLEIETKKAAEALDPEEVCEICGTAYLGKDGDAAHLKFRIHDAYTQVRDRAAELKPRVDEWRQKQKDQKEEETRKKRKEEWDKGLSKDKGNGERKSSRSPDKDRNREKDREKDKEKERDREKDREKEKDRDRDKDREREKDRDKDRGGRKRDRSRSRKRVDRDRSGSGGRKRHGGRSRSGGGGRSNQKDRRGGGRDSRSRSRRRRR